MASKKVNKDQNVQNKPRRNSLSSQQRKVKSQRGKYISLKDKILINNNNSNTQTISTVMATGYRRSMDSKMEGGNMNNNNHSHMQQHHNHIFINSPFNA